MDVVVTGRHCRAVGTLPRPCRRQARQAREARPPDHARPGGGRERTQPPPVRPGRARRADGVLQGPGRSGPRRRPTTRWAPSTSPSTRWRPRCGAPTTVVHEPTATAPATGRARRPLAEPEGTGDDDASTERQVGPITVTGDGPPVVREKTHSCATDDPRPGSLRDGAGRARLLPLRRPGDSATGRRLPPARLRLRRDLARRRTHGLTSPAWPRRVRPAVSGYRPTGPYRARDRDMLGACLFPLAMTRSRSASSSWTTRSSSVAG